MRDIHVMAPEPMSAAPTSLMDPSRAAYPHPGGGVMRTLLFLMVSGCWVEPVGVVPDDATVLVIGDSIMAWNRAEGASVALLMDAQLEESVGDAAVSGAQFVLEGDEEMDIRGQVSDRDWEWVVFDGGGNDLNNTCGCGACDAILDGLVSEDGATGAMPTFVDGLNARGTKVVMFGYMGLPPGAEYGFSECGDEMAELTRRAEVMEASRSDLWVVDGRELFDGSDLSYFDDDQLHPSVKGSQAIADALSEVVRASE